MKIWKVTLEQFEADKMGMVVSSYVTPKLMKSEEYYQSEESAKKRCEEYRAAANVLNSVSFHANCYAVEVKL